MMTMTTHVKFADAAAEDRYTNIFCKSLNLKGGGSVLEDRTQKDREASELQWRAFELWAQDPHVEGRPVPSRPLAAKAIFGRATQQCVEQDALSEMLEEMSLSTLLYYVLAGEGMDQDESS